MAYRARGSYLWSWKQTLIICLTIVVGQLFSTWYLSTRLPDTDVLTTLLSREGRSDRSGRRGSGERPRSGSSQLGGSTPDLLAVPSSQHEHDAEGAAQDGSWASTASQAVQRLDTAMARRLEKLAQDKGLELDEIMPATELRERAIASGDLRSDAAQELIAEYTRILDTLGGSQAEEAAP